MKNLLSDIKKESEILERSVKVHNSIEEYNKKENRFVKSISVKKPLSKLRIGSYKR